MKRSTLLLALAAVALVTGPASAQGPAHPQSGFQFRFGWYVPDGGGEFWNATEDTFTLDAQDLDEGVFGMSFVYGVSNNLEIGFNLDFYDGAAGSVYRQNPAPPPFYPAAYHDTELSLMPTTFDLRFLPAGRYGYRGSKGQYAVRKPVPYIGVGAGFLFYEYEEAGFFLDFEVPEGEDPWLFEAAFQDDGVTPELHVLAGIEIPVGPYWGFLFEARYSWAEASLDEDFAGLGDIELGGFSGYFGAAFHF